ncbi:histidinol dehydrogenase [Nostoc ellipsosporum NOK]|nr:histidinol dehydrogenase [Nostoc ellipsosporum NOK]
MMRVYKYPSASRWPAILQRPAQRAGNVQSTVAAIISDVKSNGDKALQAYARKFDKWEGGKLQVAASDIKAAASQLSPALRQAIKTAAANITRFHEAQQLQTEVIETQPGVRCWRKRVPIERVGLYIPGGSAPLFSTVLMLGIPARLAGCEEIVLCTPPDANGSIHPAILFAAQCCGITSIFRVGGAQAIAAMAYGTKTIPRVFKIFGPGNQYVTAAKQQLQQTVAIDMPAGPSEVLVIADETANAAYVAADLLSQAEHGPDSQVVLVTTDEQLIGQVKEALSLQLQQLERRAITKEALKHSRLILVKTMDEAISLSNYYAPEHLILSCNKAATLANKVKAAGSVFIGHFSPESAGDYASGTNHTLPTSGYAAMYSGVSVESFCKTISFQQLSRKGLAGIAGTVMTMAEGEGLQAHKQAVAIRLER